MYKSSTAAVGSVGCDTESEQVTFWQALSGQPVHFVEKSCNTSAIRQIISSGTFPRPFSISIIVKLDKLSPGVSGGDIANV